MYNFGNTLWEILHPGQVIHTDPTWTSSHCATPKHRPEVRKDPPAGCTLHAFKTYVDIMRRCRAHDPDARPTMETVHRELSELFDSTQSEP